ncbi:ORF63 [Agrotis segetum granulovirus]|uniref:38.7 kDa protein n=1 Tax=Agrotis segetum granulosis virus TaxID=10464 RepID=Q6QXP6_GVAS|nr:38.7 kDa protein [Agrotis segetum granulovirus]AAS82675.1 ORF63 [Agrotis segetum granulovirus]AHN92114.1 p38.7 [Agrotis segetum granulovirus]AKN63349.1 38.7 kDa protein [Agrotis segetum granulovirus]
MDSLVKYVRSYWFGNDSNSKDEVRTILDRCCKRVDAVETLLTNKFGKIDQDLNEMKEVFLNVSLMLKQEQTDESGQDEVDKNSPRLSNTSSCSNSSDGSNLAVYVKPRINGHTQLQYVTGRTKRYNTRKRFYQDIDMKEVIAGKESSPRKKITKINHKLLEKGTVANIGEDSFIVAHDADTVCDVILNETLKQ